MSLEAVYELPASEIMYWEEFFQHNPMNSERLDYIIWQNAVAIAVSLNSNRGKGKPVTKVTEFLPKYMTDSQKSTKKSREQQVKEAKAFASAYSRMVRTKRKP